MKTYVSLLFVALLAVSAAVWAGNSTTQTVTFEVQAINEISVSGDPAKLTINTATAGAEPDAVSDASTTYDLTTNATGKKITAVLNAAMPADVTLTINMVAPAGATSAGAVTLTNVAVDAVTDITEVTASNKTITYGMSALVTAGIVANDTRTVTLTIVDGS